MEFLIFNKLAFPIWTRVPGTPFTLPGGISYTERLPGMQGWVPRDVVERVSQALTQGEDIRTLTEREGGEGGAGATAIGAGIGGIAGGLGARLTGGQKAFSPFEELLQKGISRKTLAGLRGVSPGMRYAPLAGAGLGGLAALSQWASQRGEREEGAEQVARGLLAEKVLQRRALEEAVKTQKPYTGSILRGLPVTSASSPPPYVAMPGGSFG
jgi:hypothetical protein